MLTGALFGLVTVIVPVTVTSLIVPVSCVTVTVYVKVAEVADVFTMVWSTDFEIPHVYVVVYEPLAVLVTVRGAAGGRGDS